jgi:hypothetical protein
MHQPGATIIIESKLVGHRKSLIPDWRIPLPPERNETGALITLRDLITRIVGEEVEAFQQRQEQRRLLHVLTARQIEQAVISGKVDMGGRELDQPIDPPVAVATALQAFADGLYYVFIDDEQQNDLEHEVYVHPNSRVTFIRLVALAGG